LKFRDFGKIAATFCDLRDGRAVRVLAREDAKRRAQELYPQIGNRNQQQMQAYRELPDAELFEAQWVRVAIGPEDLPAYKGPRVACGRCGEAISSRGEVVRDGALLCGACAGERYYERV